jgi:hypothetical protein
VFLDMSILIINCIYYDFYISVELVTDFRVSSKLFVDRFTEGPCLFECQWYSLEFIIIDMS